MRCPIFILGAHKSGTSLLRNLLDSHSQLFVLPFEAHYFELSKYWVENPYRKTQPGYTTATETQSAMINYIRLLNESNDRYADSVMKKRINTKLFIDKLALAKSESEKERIIKYFSAIAYSLGEKRDIEKFRFVEKSVENNEFAMELKHFFPDAKFIHIIRNPYSNFVALRKYKSINYGYPLLDKLICTLHQNFYWLEKNLSTIKNYHVVKYEDLVTNPEIIMRSICNFLDIGFEDTLLKPTTLGIEWEGNSTSNTKFKGIDAGNLNNWQKELYPYEAFIINRTFNSMIKKYNYVPFNVRGSIWKKNKGENLLRYIYNRIFQYYLR